MTTTLHLGAQLPVNSTPGHQHPGLDLAAVARHAEQLGLDSVWAGDRLSAPFPVLDASLVLATAAAATTRIRIGHGVLLLGLRNVAWAAKQISTLQQLSRGRVDLGIGVGSGDATEWAAAGLTPQGRGRRTEQLLRLLPDLVEGRPTRLPDQPGAPTLTLSPPAPMPDVWIGGGSDTALRRAVTHGQGWLAALKTPDQLDRAADRLADLAAERQLPTPRVSINVHVHLTQHPAAARTAATTTATRLSTTYGLDPATAADIAVGGTPQHVAERLHAYAEAGAEQFILVPEGDNPFHQYDLMAETRALLTT